MQQKLLQKSSQNSRYSQHRSPKKNKISAQKDKYSRHESQKSKLSSSSSIIKSQIDIEYLKRPLMTSTILGDVISTEIYFDVKIDAKIKKQVKTILHQQKGLIHPESFTAILGPSGSGKTTLLNFLSGRLMTTNLIIQGQLQINSVPIASLEPYSDQIVYVMQDDALLPMLTPRECFMFAANLTLNIPHEKKVLRAQQLIRDLGLLACSDIRIGAPGSKGLSGGQRKRVSIGVELITNPGIIFLDQPTTGLDSTTALQVILLLKRLADQGRAVVSTIHQPSSQIYQQFDRLMLLCDGHCIYQGLSNQASHHFSNIGYKLPKLVNPAQFYLDLMSLQADSQENTEDYQTARMKFNQKILKCEKEFIESEFYNFQRNTNLQPLQIYKKNQVSTFYQIYILMTRAFFCVVRNPLDVGYKIIQAILTAVVAAIIFGQMQDEELQNVKGLNFFFVTTSVMYGVNGTLATFSSQKPIFLRQRYSKIYSTWTYFISRTAVNIPFQILYATVFLTILYFWTSFGQTTFDQYLKFVLSVNATYFYAVSIGLLYSAAIPKLQHAMATIPIIIIPMNLLSGFFLNLDKYDDIRVIFYPLLYISPFKYGYQAGMIILKDFFPQFSQDLNFRPDTYQENVLILFGLAVIFRILACIIMIIRSNPKRPKVKKSKNQISINIKDKKSKRSLMTSQKQQEVYK